jgi:hypothetical protein
MAKTKLDSMQIVAKKKRLTAKQAELEALEAENDVEAIELEIEVVKRKSCIEETFWRFPHIGEQIFDELEDTTLTKCLEINKWWQKIIIDRKIRQINQLEKNTYIKSSILRKALGNKDFETVHKLANCSMKVYRKVIIDENHEGYEYRKQQKEIIGYLFKKKYRDNIQHLLTELMLKNCKQFEIEPLIRNGEFDLLQMLCEHLKIPNLMKVYKKIHLSWSKGDYSGEYFFEAFGILYPYTEHNKLRGFYLSSQIVKNFSTQTDCSGGLVLMILRSDAN